MKNIILVVVLQTVLVAGVGAGGWFLGKGSVSCEAAAGGEGADGAAGAAATEQRDPVFTQFDPFLLNIQDGNRRRFLQVEIVAKSFDPAVTDAVDKYNPRIRGEVLAAFSHFNSQQLDSPDGRTAMAEKGKQTLNLILEEEAGLKEPVADVYITKLVIQ